MSGIGPAGNERTRSPARGVRAAAMALLLPLALLGNDDADPADGSTDVDSGTDAGAATRYLNHDPGVQYVGRDRCKLCHLGIHATFTRTGMGRAFYPVQREIIVEDFTNNNRLEAGGLHYRMFERDGRYFQRQFVLDSKGGELVAEEHELVWIVGSNNHSRGYLIERDEKLFEAPVCWDPTEKQWMLCPGFELKNEHFSREIGHTCVFCHNGRMELVPGERNRYRKPFPHGIGCERCHGPGQLHVERYLGADRPTEDPKLPTIVNPARLPPTERIHVCFQCHLGDASATERVMRPGRAMESFRPGQRVTDYMIPFRYVEPTRYDFGIASQADRLLLSRCYTESGGKIECLTCHNPHITVYHEQRPADHFIKRCLGCHERTDCPAPAEARAATEPADDCVSCHMRRGEPVDRRYAQFTDHWIRRRIEGERDPRRSFELEPVFPASFAALPAGERAFVLGRAHFLKALQASPRTGAWHMQRAESAFRESLGAGLDTAEAWFFLGKTQMFGGRTQEAALSMDEALARDPTHHDAAFALGQAIAARGQYRQAAAVFARMLEQDPSDPMALAEHGRCAWALGHPEAALAAYDRAVELEPWNAELHLNRGMVLASLDRFEEAAAAATEAARRDPDRVGIWEFVEKVMERTGRQEQAAEARIVLRRLRR